MKISNPTCIAVILLLTPLGCKARELGANYADTQSDTVDNTWVAAVETCWPAVGHGYSSGALKHYLADPIHFRAAFTAYAPLSDQTLRAVVALPVSSAPMPDISMLQHSRSPVLSRAQAVSGAANSASTAPGLDSLCAIQPGLPVGFR